MELEAERLETAKGYGSSYTAQSGSRRPSEPKRKKNQGEKNKNPRPALDKVNSTKCKRGKRGSKKGKTNTACFNYDKKGHFTRDCTELKKVLPNLSSRFFLLAMSC